MNIANLIGNTIIQLNLGLFAAGIVLTVFTGNLLFLGLTLYVFLINECLYLLFDWDIYHSHARTEIIYSGASLPKWLVSDDYLGIHSNLTEGLYPPGKESIDWQEAERNRFAEFMRLLDIQPGDAVLDAGCGQGALVAYLRDRGVDAIGITISKTQFKGNTNRLGPHFAYGDYTQFRTDFVGRFDHIILPGSLEHPFGGIPLRLASYERKYTNMVEMWRMMDRYFKPTTRSGKILTTCLHVNTAHIGGVRSFVTERVFGGLYPLIGTLSVGNSLRDAGFTVSLESDYSWHYFHSTVADLSHFGNPVDIGLPSVLALMLLYPHLVYIYIYWKRGYWMWMWDGKDHRRRSSDATPGDLTFDENSSTRPCSLLYTLGSRSRIPRQSTNPDPHR